MFAVLLGILLAAAPMYSQTATGRITGTVRDQSGGAIVGAAVVVTDVARGLTRNLTTDESGSYLAVQLIAGTYTVRATFTGFQAWERQNIALGVGQEIAIDAVLLPGAQTQTVTVTEELPLVNTTSATLGGTLSNETIVDLPLNGRNFTLLLELRPGVILTLGNDSGGTGAAATNGLRPEQSNEYIVEGLHGSSPFNAQPIFNALALRGDAATILPVDAIQEFNQQFNAKAEYGWRAGGTVNVGLKSGTNAYHGTGYAFFRRDGMDAQNYFTPKVNTNLNQFGGSLGGPIMQDKFFFFGTVEAQRVDVGDTARSTTPFTDVAMLTAPGGLAACVAARTCTGIAGSVNGHAEAPDARNHLILACQALALGERSPQSLSLAGLNADCTPGSTYPNSVTGATWFIPHSGTGATSGGINGTVPITSYFSNLQSEVRAVGAIGKLDYAYNDSNTFSGFVFFGNGDNIYSANKTQPIWRTSVKAHAKMFGGTWTWLASPAVANALRIGYVNNTQRYRGLDALEGTSAAALGLPTGVTEFPDINGGYPQSLAINGFTALGSRNTELEGPYTSLEISDQISYLLGDHNLRFGGTILTNNQNGASWGDTRGRFGFGQGGGAGTNGLVAFMNGQLGYSDNIDDGVGSNYCPGLVSGVAPAQTCNMPLIRTSSDNTGLQSAIRFYGDPTTHMRRTAYSAFLQDDWRVRPRLTVNLGVRFELTSVLHDRDNILGTFDPQRGLIQEGVHTPRIYNPDHNNWGPRVGFAWDVQGDGKTVVRAGASIIYELVTFRTFTEIGNDIGVGANPTAFVTGCTVTPTPDVGGPFDFNLAPGFSDNCASAGGSFITPGGNRNVGSIEWSRGDGTIASLNWDAASGGGTIYPSSDAVKSCSPDLAFSDNPLLPTLGRPGVACPVVTSHPRLRTPYVTSWTFSIQRAITNNVVLEAAYVGNHGTKFMSHVDLNQTDPAGNFWDRPSGVGSLSYADNCIADPNIDNCDGSALSGDIFDARPFDSKFSYLATITELGNQHWSNYNGLQVSLTARNFHGFSAVSGYTWSKALDVASGNGSDVGTDSYNVALDYGRANSDVRHRVTFAPTYTLPSVMGYGGLLSGWRVNANIKYQTGRGYAVGGSDFGGNGREESRWDLTGDPNDFKTDYKREEAAIYHPSFNDFSVGDDNPQADIPGQAAAYAVGDFATNTAACTAGAGPGKLATLAAFGCWTQGSAALTPPAPGSFGNMGRGRLSGPGFFGMDMSISKRHQITERLTAEFRGEFFNVLNKVAPASIPETGVSCEAGDCLLGQVFETPDTAATNPVLGTGGPRRVQVGIKLIF